jgi:hypothetical protein
MRVFEGRPAPLNKMRARRIEGAEVDSILRSQPRRGVVLILMLHKGGKGRRRAKQKRAVGNGFYPPN